MVDPQRGPSSRKPAKGPGKRKKPISTRKKWTLRIVRTVGALVLLGLVSLTAIVVIGYQTTTRPDANADFRTSTTTVYYNDGKTQLGTFAVQNRQPITFDQMPDSIKQAVVSAENRSFWTDKGISFRGMARAAVTIARGGDLQGGSTITQQYIKIMYLNADQTLTRKFKELFLAYKINKEMTKEEILTDYLNTIYFGHGAYGVQAASKAYFNVDAKKLTVPQAAFLATVLNNPTIFDPDDEDNADRILERYRYVIQSMAETGAITAEQATEYSTKLPKFPKIATSERYGGPKGFLLKMVERELAAAGFDPSQVSGGGLKIVTTFDKSAQDAAVESAQKYTKMSADAANEKASNLHAAIASVKVGTGEVLALYGGPDFVKNSRNWATTPRPTASTFKTYALAAGLENGYSLRSTFNGNTFTPNGDSSTVRNEYNYMYGPAVSLIKATAQSINTAFVDLTTKIDDGPKKVSDVAQAVGAPKGPGWDLNSRIALGTAEVSPLAHANAYATFANDGTFVASHVVKEVKSSAGKVLYKANPTERRAVSADVAHDVTFALEDVVEEGTGRSVQTLNRPIAGKTGTKDGVKNDITSAWFVAYTKQISTAVMYVAGDSGGEDLDAYARPGDRTFFGGTYPALTWADYMQTATKDLPVKDFDPPAYVNSDKAPAPQPSYTRPPSQEPTQTQEPSQTPTDRPTQTPTERPTESASAPETSSRPTQSQTQEPTQPPTTTRPSSRPSQSGGGDQTPGGGAPGGAATPGGSG